MHVYVRVRSRSEMFATVPSCNFEIYCGDLKSPNQNSFCQKKNKKTKKIHNWYYKFRRHVHLISNYSFASICKGNVVKFVLNYTKLMVRFHFICSMARFLPQITGIIVMTLEHLSVSSDSQTTLWRL